MKRILLIFLTISVMFLYACSSLQQCPNSYLERMENVKYKSNSNERFATESVGLIWSAQRGCTTGLLCENEHWKLSRKGDGCAISYVVSINGEIEKVPMFFIDPDTSFFICKTKLVAFSGKADICIILTK